MRASHALETLLAASLAAGVRALPWRASLGIGERLGELLLALGVRRRVAADNLARALPDRSDAERHEILRQCYRELGRVAVEYPRLAELSREPAGVVVAEARGLEHLMAAREAGRGAILMTGHFGNFELFGAYLGRLHPVDFVVKPLSNPAVEAMLNRWRARAGVGNISTGIGVRRVFEALKANRWVALVADQDARRHGVFVPFLGRMASTPRGPAEFALASGAPIITGWITRRPDGRHSVAVDPPIRPSGPRSDAAVLELTRLHTQRLEQRVRERPENWLWLHQRWKTSPPYPAED